MAWELADNIRGPKGDKGDAGSIGSASVATLPAGSPAKVTMSGNAVVRHLHLEVPQGSKGDRGPAGTLSSASAESVPAGENAEVIMSGSVEVKHAHFKVPRGLPGVNGVENDEAMAALIAALDSETRGDLDLVIDAHVDAYQEGRALNIRSFGAVGDGVADDTAAVQAFFDYLADNGGSGIAEGRFRLTDSIQIENANKGFTVRGAGMGADGSVFAADFPSQKNVFSFVNIDGLTLTDMRVVGDVGVRASHAISGANCRNSLLRNVHITGQLNSGAIFYQHPSFSGISHDNRFEFCVVDGKGIANNGLLHGESANCSMIGCTVLNLNRALGAPAYALQFKNGCSNGEIIGGFVDGANAAVAFGYEDDAPVQTNMTVTGVIAQNVNHGLLGSRFTGATIDIIVDMANGGLTAVNLAGNARMNVVYVSAKNPAPTATIVRIQESFNKVNIGVVEMLGEATLVDMPSTSSRNQVAVGVVTDRTPFGMPGAKIVNAGSSNTVRFDDHASELHAFSLAASSFLRFTAPGVNNTWIQYDHAAQTFLFRTEGVTRLVLDADALYGVDNAMSLGTAARRWTEVHTRNGVIIQSPNGTRYRVQVSNTGELSTTPA